MSRRHPVGDALASALTTLAVFAIAVGVAVAWFTNWPAEMAIWLSGVVAGLLAGPPLRKVLARMAGKPAIREIAAGRRSRRRQTRRR
ncbi:MAG TPA: hypothetical protein VM347_26635 [Nonomuraea sp.]|nr:hypothetical protein [Nonomuraea sp.]